MSRLAVETNVEVSIRLTRNGENIDPLNYVNDEFRITFDSRRDAEKFANKVKELIGKVEDE